MSDTKMLIADTLRLFVGHGRRIGWADLSAATGDEERKLRSYVEDGGPQMPLDVFMRVFAVLPPEAFARVAGKMGYSVGMADVDDMANVRSVLAAASRLVADGNEALEDGELSHSERVQLGRDAAVLMPKLAALTTH